MQKIIAVIPARYMSSRFVGKPLADISGKIMIERVYEQVKKATNIDEVFVATDDDRIYQAVKQFHGNVIMTGECSCGTERVYEAVKNLACDIVINVQGDEPLIKPEMIEEVIAMFHDVDVNMATLCKEIVEKEDIVNTNIVKVVRDRRDNALYFSRNPIPYNRNNLHSVKYYKHIGIYGYKKDFLEKLIKIERSLLEKAEDLEQLRVLENGYQIKVGETVYDSIGVDKAEDILRIEEQLENE